MTSRGVLAALGSLLLVLGCDRALVPPQPPAVYAPWEDGLTLVYERADLAQDLRKEARQQVRVAKCEVIPEGRRVELTSENLQGQERVRFFLPTTGGVFVQDERGGTKMVLPPGFPDRCGRWTVDGVQYGVLGYGRVESLMHRLPRGHAGIGVWVEGVLPSGHRQRSFFLPDIGEVETQLLHEGTWKPLLQMVSRGFTDGPPVKAD